MNRIRLGYAVIWPAMLAVILATGCRQSGYTITGSVSDSTMFEHSVFLGDISTGETIDTAVIGNDGGFTFTGTVSKPVLASVSVEFSELGSLLILENGNIRISFNNADVPGTAIVGGTPLNDELERLQEENDTINSSMNGHMAAISSDITLGHEQIAARNRQVVEKYVETMNGMFRRYFEKNRDNPVGLFALINWMGVDPGINLDSIVSTCSSDIRENAFIVQQLEYNRKIQATAEGRKYIDLSGTDHTGERMLSLSDFVGNGKPVLVDFWASWCVPCRQEIPYIERINRLYRDKVIIVGLNVWDKPEDFRKAVKEQKIAWPQILEPEQGAFTEPYAITGIPQIMLIDTDGTILAKNLRGPAIETTIKKVLGIK